MEDLGDSISSLEVLQRMDGVTSVGYQEQVGKMVAIG